MHAQAAAPFPLLTPEDLYQLLLSKFKIYKEHNKPEFFIDKVAPHQDNDLHNPNNADQAAASSGLAASLGSFLKSTVSRALEYREKHTTLTDFFSEEMANIINAKDLSQLKKMTDLVILFHGLEAYLARTNSTELRALMNGVAARIWPCPANANIIEHPVHYGTLGPNDVVQIITTKLGDCKETEEISISRDEAIFMSRFYTQIQRACHLISHNTSIISKQQNAKTRANPLLCPEEFDYYCREPNSPANQEVNRPTAWMSEAYGAILSNTIPDGNYPGVD